MIVCLPIISRAHITIRVDISILLHDMDPPDPAITIIMLTLTHSTHLWGSG